MDAHPPDEIMFSICEAVALEEALFMSDWAQNLDGGKLGM
jgi:hypothetical protein